MKWRNGRTLALLLAIAGGREGVAVAQRPVIAFTHVGVVPMDTERVLLDQTVLVRDGRVVALGPAAGVAVPAGATRIDGQGKYLIPGLADMHSHLGGTGGQLNEPARSRSAVENELFLYAANGVTTIRSVNYLGGIDSLVLRARGLAAEGQLWSPRIYASGNWRVRDGESVARNIEAYQAAGYDFLKLHENTGESGPSLDSLLSAAHLLGIPVMGHVGEIQDSLMHALEAHYASIEHLTGYPGGGLGSSTVTADTIRLPAMIAATARAGVWNTPTQVLYDLSETADPNPWPEDRFGGRWVTLMKDVDSLTVQWWKLRKRIIRGLQDAGAGLLLGTDSPLLAPGFGVHRELQSLVHAGLTPYQALATGTRNVAAYFGKLRDEGTVAIGKRADLVLLTGNPLEDIQRTMNPAGVMVGGRWLARTEIDRRLSDIAAAMAKKSP